MLERLSVVAKTLALVTSNHMTPYLLLDPASNEQDPLACVTHRCPREISQYARPIHNYPHG
jgi:hypothetical protein